MENHSNFAAGRFMGCNPKIQQLEQWQKVADIVSENGPLKTVDQLKRVSHSDINLIIFN